MKIGFGEQGNNRNQGNSGNHISSAVSPSNRVNSFSYSNKITAQGSHLPQRSPQGNSSNYSAFTHPNPNFV
jgi:hypothetical protein